MMTRRTFLVHGGSKCDADDGIAVDEYGTKKTKSKMNLENKKIQQNTHEYKDRYDEIGKVIKWELYK